MIQRIRCFFGRHKYHTIEVYSTDVRKLGCKFCNKQFGMNDRVKALVEWDEEFEKAHEEIRSSPYYN